MIFQSLKVLYSRIKKPELTKEEAESKVCQEIFIFKVGSSPLLSKRIAFKGGLILDSLAKGKRGYTKDIDFDFIKYPLSKVGLNSFINDLNKVEIFSNIKISISSEEELRHKNYRGKRLLLCFSDGISKYNLLVDIGIYLPLTGRNISHNYEILFGGATKILINPIERILAEKLSTFAIYGLDNTRFKDLFDACYIILRFKFDNLVVKKMLYKILVRKNHYFKKIEYGLDVIKSCLKNKTFINELDRSNRNWLNLPITDVCAEIIAFINKIY